MKFKHLHIAGLALALVGAATLVSNRPVGGDKADYTFRDAPVNSLGIRSLADLRGKPVLIDFWGIN
jgi:hypothetical protein